MNSMNGNHLDLDVRHRNRNTLDVQSRGKIAVVPVSGIPGKDGENGESAPAPIDPVLAFDGVLAGHEE